MARQVNTHHMIRHYTAAFATILDEIKIVNGRGEEQQIPLIYSAKEKWISSLRQNSDMQEYAKAFTLPRMGMELTGMNYSPNRSVNKLGKIVDGKGNFVMSRMPWDFSFSVYIGATRMNDANQIVEQIAPYFTPGFTITTKDVEELDLETNVTIVLNSISYQVEYEGSYDQERTIVVEMQFTVQGYLYQVMQNAEMIKVALINMRSGDFSSIYERITDRVEPFEANINDPHTIITTIEVNPEDDSGGP